MPPVISPNIVILTRDELHHRETEAFKRGVRLGRMQEAAKKPTPKKQRDGQTVGDIAERERPRR